MSPHRKAHWPLGVPAPAADDTTLVFVLPPKIGAHMFPPPPSDAAAKTLQVHVLAPASQKNLIDFLRAVRQAAIELLGTQEAVTRAGIKIAMARMTTYMAVGPGSPVEGLRTPLSTGDLFGIPGLTLILSATADDLVPLVTSIGMSLFLPE